MDSELRQDIMEVIPEKIPEMYVDEAILNNLHH